MPWNPELRAVVSCLTQILGTILLRSSESQAHAFNHRAASLAVGFVFICMMKLVFIGCFPVLAAHWELLKPTSAVWASLLGRGRWLGDGQQLQS